MNLFGNNKKISPPPRVAHYVVFLYSMYENIFLGLLINTSSVVLSELRANYT
jgi:hypothetical protein